MSNNNQNSSENPEQNMENADQTEQENLEGVQQDDIDSGAMDALSDAEAASSPAEELSLEEQQAAEIAELKDKLLRTLADMENLRRRAEKDKEDAHNFAVTKFARDMLGVSDNLRRALDAVPEEARTDETVKNILTGVEMTDSEILKTFAKHKIEKIESVGKKFDPNFHQAMFEIENPEVETGTVLQEVQSGYVIAGRLLRPSLVGVSKGGQDKPAGIDQTA